MQRYIAFLILVRYEQTAEAAVWQVFDVLMGLGRVVDVSIV